MKSTRAGHKHAHCQQPRPVLQHSCMQHRPVRVQVYHGPVCVVVVVVIALAGVDGDSAKGVSPHSVWRKMSESMEVSNK